MTPPTRKPSLTDLTEDPWPSLPPLMPPAQPGGRPRAVDLRASIHTLLSLNRPGCPWALRPHALRPKSTVWEYFAPWRDEGPWPPRMDALRAAGRQPPAPSQEPTPRAARSDSQAVKMTEQGGARG
jgi:putative transposase